MTKRIYYVEIEGERPRFFGNKTAAEVWRDEIMASGGVSAPLPRMRWRENLLNPDPERVASRLNAALRDGMEYAARILAKKAEEDQQ